MTSPLRAEVYFVNMRVFANLKWGTRDPVAFRDSELGLVRLRAFGVFNVRVLQPVLFVNSLVGTQGVYTTEAVEEYLSRVIVSRFNDHLGEHLDSVLNLPGRYDEISEGLKRELQKDFSRYGLGLYELYINAITPPQDVQRAIDDKGRLAVFDDLNKLLKMKAAMALEKVSEAGETAGAGLGVGLGMLMPAMFAEFLRTSANGAPESAACPHCSNTVTRDARFCPRCGTQLLVFGLCAKGGREVPPEARFCPSCGKAVGESPAPRICPGCGAENLPGSVYCNRCGDKLNDKPMGS
jgi:membrane protease subunit (stomatin/prohibitin family)